MHFHGEIAPLLRPRYVPSGRFLGFGYQGRVWFHKSKFQKKNPAPAWRVKSRRNKKRIATAAYKSRDESNQPN